MIGVGLMGRRHAENLVRHVSDARLLGVTDADESARERVAKDPPGPTYRLRPPQRLSACQVVTSFCTTRAAWLVSSRTVRGTYRWPVAATSLSR